MAVLAMAVLLCTGLRAQRTKKAADPRAVQSLFLAHFAKLFHWPATALPAESRYFTVGVVGKDSLGRYLDVALAKKRVGRRRFRTLRFGPWAKLKLADEQKLASCQILFLATTDAKEIAAIRRLLERRPVLLVSTTPGFAASGGMVELFQQGKKVRFQIVGAAVSRAGLRASANVMKLSRIAPVPKPKRRE